MLLVHSTDSSLSFVHRFGPVFGTGRTEISGAEIGESRTETSPYTPKGTPRGRSDFPTLLTRCSWDPKCLFLYSLCVPILLDWFGNVEGDGTGITEPDLVIQIIEGTTSPEEEQHESQKLPHSPEYGMTFERNGRGETFSPTQDYCLDGSHTFGTCTDGRVTSDRESW